MRNLKAVSLALPSGLTLVVGRNGQGKTGLLEAVYLLGTGRSFRTRRAGELIAWDGGPLRVAGSVDSRRGRSRLAVVLDGESKSLLLDGANKELEAYIGTLDVVDLSAERMRVVRGAPGERRRFLDRGVLGLRPAYLRSLGEYRRVVEQRNALLRAAPSRERARNPTQLEAWDERLLAAATEIHRRRREYAVLLATKLGEIGRTLFPEHGELRLRYRPSPAEAGEADPAEFPERYARALHRARARDLALRQTCLGPHRDEMIVELDGVDLRRFGSAGQVRAAMIALKFGKLCLLREDRGEAPVFLMDDFDSDLDEERAAALAGFLQRGGFQALVATSKEGMADGLEGVSFTKIRMDNGVARAA